MKKILLLAATAMLSLSASAQWTLPKAPQSASPEDLAASGQQVKVLNVEQGGFLTGSNAWGTQSSLTATGCHWIVERSDDGVSFKLKNVDGPKSGSYLFRDNASGCFVDMGNQNRGFNWSFTSTSDGYYTIKSPQDDPVYGEELYENWEHEFFGWNSTAIADDGVPNLVFANISDIADENVDEEGNPVPFGIEWSLISDEAAAEYAEAVKPYNAAMDLMNAIQKAQEDYPELNLDAQMRVYNNTNSTVEELEAAKKSIVNAIGALRSQEVLKGATADNPKDGTELIENADFSAGNINGWVNSFVSGTTATNCGYQQNNYTGPVWTDPETGEDYTPVLTKFIEAWANNVNEMKRDGKSFATIGDAKLYQIIYGLPAGKYKLSCDAIAVQQWDGSQNPVTGVQLYVIAGSLNASENLSSGNEKPEHRVLTFIHDGGDVELGMRTESTTANWIAASNFHLTYFGEITENPYQVMLNDYVADLQKKYPDLDEVKAGGDAKSAYETALAAATDAQDGQSDEYYQNLKSELEGKVADLNASAEAYKKIASTLAEAETRAAEAEDANWGGLAEKIYDDIINKYKEDYDNGDLVADDAAKIDEELNELIANYVSENVKAGDDVTVLLKNPGFTNNFSGWKNEGGVLAWSNNYAQGENQAEAAANIEAPSREDGLAEKWHEKFTMTQTIKNMPRGLYTLSCQGFNRHDDGEDDVSAVLYAILPDGSEQTAPFASIDDYATEDKLYDNGEWSSDAERNGKWAPNGMSGSAWHFMNKSDGENYDYESKINIIMTEAGDLTVGARCDYEHQWVIFDNFRIVYQGSGANVYADAIADKIKQGEKALAEGQLYGDDEICGASAEVVTAWGKVADAATAASSEEDCIQALTDLDKAIEAIRTSNALVKKVWDAYNFNMEIRFEDSDYSDDPELNRVLDNILDLLTGNGFATDDDMAAAITDMDAAFCKAAVNAVADELASASEENPVDVSGIIANATYGMQFTEAENPVPTAACWTNSRGFSWMAPNTTDLVVGTNEQGETYHIAECWSDVFTTSQKLYNLPVGFYQLTLNAFQRGYGFNKHSEMAAETGFDHLPAKLFAGEAETPIVSLFSEGDNYEYEGAVVDGGKYDGQTVPNSMGQAAEAFDGGLFKNILQFQVTEAAEVKAFASQVAGPKNCIEIGIKKDTNENDSWVIWGNWGLKYLGTAEPANDPTTAIMNLNSPIVSAKYFNVNGAQQSKLQKGVNIVKVTRANGSTKMVKVLVK